MTPSARPFYLTESIFLCRCSVHYFSIIFTNIFKSVQDPSDSYGSSEYVMNFCLFLLSNSSRIVIFLLKCVNLHKISGVFHSLPKKVESTHVNVVLLREKEVMV